MPAKVGVGIRTGAESFFISQEYLEPVVRTDLGPIGEMLTIPVFASGFDLTEGIEMAGRLVTDELWSEIEPLFPKHRQSCQGGRPPVDNRSVFTCIVFMLKTGIGYRDLPTEMGASEKTVRRRLKSWSEQGLWDVIFERLLAKLRLAGRLDLAEVLIDGGLLKAPCGGEKSVPIPQIAAAAAVS